MTVPILMYHRVAPIRRDDQQHHGDGLRDLTVEPEQFESHIEWLARRGFHAVSLDDLADHLAHDRPFPERATVITFDDGYEDCLEYAVPVLKRHGFTATFYLVSDFVGKSSDWDLPIVGWTFPLFDWHAARALDADGFTIGSHSKMHPVLTDLDAGECFRELDESKRAIESQLGHEAPHVSYPFGAANASARSAAVAAGYRTACCSRRGRVGVGADPHMLPRIEITGHDSLRDVKIRMRGLPPPWVVRRRIRRLLGRL